MERLPLLESVTRDVNKMEGKNHSLFSCAATLEPLLVLVYLLQLQSEFMSNSAIKETFKLLAAED